MTSALLKNVGALVEQLQCLARQAHVEYSSEVDAIIRSKSRDSRRIEHLLDGILGFCFDEEMLRLYKKLSRYYYFIDPAATATYVNFYREMWDLNFARNRAKLTSVRANTGHGRKPTSPVPTLREVGIKAGESGLTPIRPRIDGAEIGPEGEFCTRCVQNSGGTMIRRSVRGCQLHVLADIEKQAGNRTWQEEETRCQEKGQRHGDINP